MLKLTKAQWKDKDRIDAWLAGLPFKENSKAKPAVPVLSEDMVLDTYVPGYIQEFGAYYTPSTMAYELFSNIQVSSSMSVLDPCAGIGNLLVPFVHYDMKNLTAIEADESAFRIGQKLFPQVNWLHANAFSTLPESKYDIVVMNPPFGITWAVQEGLANSVLCKKSEHLFLELALKHAKRGGTVALIAPYNTILNMPVAFEDWFRTHTRQVTDLGELAGEFRFTKIHVHGFIIERNMVPLSGILGEPVQSGVPETKDVSPYVQIDTLPDGSAEIVYSTQEGKTWDVEEPVTDNEKDAVPGSPEAYKQYRDFIGKRYGHVLSPKQSTTLHEAKFLHLVPDFVAWLEKASQYEYGMLFYHGMKPVPPPGQIREAHE